MADLVRTRGFNHPSGQILPKFDIHYISVVQNMAKLLDLKENVRMGKTYITTE